MPKEVSSQPLYAKIAGMHPKGGYATTTVLWIFGRSINQTFTGPGHYDKAIAWVNEWNEHLDREWMKVRETSATIMQEFIAAIRRQGVRQSTVDAAMEGMKAHAKG